ncbi:MAG: cyclic pyranopterin monophosphate synthase [Thermoplasmata archaeon]|jgi:cyclic pyranopterin phosphate synthase|nr:cyclic pyranopterin monophosphate synthase [Thermoplasmata archaeon]
MEDDPFRGRSLAASKAKRFAPPPQRQPQPSPESAGRMADVGGKPVVKREARAEGFLRLKPATLAALREGRAPKGDPFPVARVAGILAAKNTPDLVPLCHPIPLTAVDVEFETEAEGVRVRTTVRAEWRTGVEMEALAACAAALLTVWDMTKALEKDATGNYPDTAIESIRVTSKVKG